MPDVMTCASQLTDRLSNRLIWKMAPKTRTVDTDVPLVTFTFDDVPDTALTHGATILEQHGARGTFYIAGSLGGQVERDRTLISPEGCRELARRGHEIGCHTFAHRRIRTFGRSLADDLDHSRHYLSECGVEQTPRNFAFPYNAAWPLARRILKRRYLTCRGAGEAINRGNVDPWMLKSVEIRQPEEHSLSLTRWIDNVRQNPGWLIFFTHDIAEKPTPYGCTPATFERLVGHAAAQGCRIVTVAEATRQLGWEETSP